MKANPLLLRPQQAYVLGLSIGNQEKRGESVMRSHLSVQEKT